MNLVGRESRLLDFGARMLCRGRVQVGLRKDLIHGAKQFKPYKRAL